MSAASVLLSSAFSTLLSVSGEALTLKRAGTTEETISAALVNRPEGWESSKQPGFPAGDVTKIQFLQSAVTSQPKRGETLVSASERFRLRRDAKPINGWWHCECESSVIE